MSIKSGFTIKNLNYNFDLEYNDLNLSGDMDIKGKLIVNENFNLKGNINDNLKINTNNIITNDSPYLVDIKDPSEWYFNDLTNRPFVSITIQNLKNIINNNNYTLSRFDVNEYIFTLNNIEHVNYADRYLLINMLYDLSLQLIDASNTITSDISYNINLDLSFIPNVYNQGHIGSCYANSTALSLHYITSRMLQSQNLQQEKGEYIILYSTPSRPFIEYNYKKINNAFSNKLIIDQGGIQIIALLSIQILNSCPSESIYTYPLYFTLYNTQFEQLTEVEKQKLIEDAYHKLAYPPDASIYNLSLPFYKNITTYSVNNDHNTFKYLLTRNIPICIDIVMSKLYESYNSLNEITYKTPILFLPEPTIGAVEDIGGGHAITIVGYDDEYKIKENDFLTLEECKNIINNFTISIERKNEILNLFDDYYESYVTYISSLTGAYIIQNSWGSEWAINGRAYLFYDQFFNSRPETYTLFNCCCLGNKEIDLINEINIHIRLL